LKSCHFEITPLPLNVFEIFNYRLRWRVFVLLTIDRRDRELTVCKPRGDMNAYRELDVVSTTPKLVDVSKYNLRCNRNISEKMTKKDFIYDIRTPVQTVRKVPFSVVLIYLTLWLAQRAKKTRNFWRMCQGCIFRCSEIKLRFVVRDTETTDHTTITIATETERWLKNAAVCRDFRKGGQRC